MSNIKEIVVETSKGSLDTYKANNFFTGSTGELDITTSNSAGVGMIIARYAPCTWNRVFVKLEDSPSSAG